MEQAQLEKEQQEREAAEAAARKRLGFMDNDAVRKSKRRLKKKLRKIAAIECVPEDTLEADQRILLGKKSALADELLLLEQLFPGI